MMRVHPVLYWTVRSAATLWIVAWGFDAVVTIGHPTGARSGRRAPDPFETRLWHAAIDIVVLLPAVPLMLWRQPSSPRGSAATAPTEDRSKLG
jgi:hypothetical protein